jgi:hypothetical protein
MESPVGSIDRDHVAARRGGDWTGANSTPWFFRLIGTYAATAVGFLSFTPKAVAACSTS